MKKNVPKGSFFLSKTLFETFLIMKLIIAALFFTVFQVQANNASGQHISLRLKNTEVKNVLAEIEKTTPYRFIYNYELSGLKKPLDFSVRKASLKETLNKLLDGNDLTYKILNKNLIAIVSTIKTEQQQATIKGQITTKDGEPIPGVSVIEKGTTNGAVTDVNGQYKITVGDGAVLVFRAIGFLKQEVVVDKQTTINVTLETAISQLDEVVVVGYGSQKQRLVTGSVVRANLEAFTDAPNTNVLQSLQGSVPGLNVGPVTVAGETPNIRIRGQGTISGNQNVLIILDGIPYPEDLRSINPDDIASIDLLKDASSTAVYGAQAANGVLLITTKKGKNNSKPLISFSTSYATQTPSKDLHPMRRDEFVNYIRDLNYDLAFSAPDYTTPNPSFDIFDNTKNGGIPFPNSFYDADGKMVTTDFDWWGEGTQTGYINDNQLSINGGGNKVTYLIGAGYTDQAGFIKNDLFKRTNVRANIETKPTDWLTIGLQSFGSLVNRDGEEAVLRQLFEFPSLSSPYDADGKLAILPIPSIQNLNPFLSSDVNNYNRDNVISATTYAKVDFPLKGLSYQVNFGNNYQAEKDYNFSKYAENQTGEAKKEDIQRYQLTLDNILTYTRNFNKHDITITGLYGIQKREYDRTAARSVGFSNFALGYNALELGNLQYTTSDAWKQTANYYMGRVNYAYNNRYILTATIRRDGFSGFAINNKWATFPSVSAGWIFSDESFMKELSWLNFGKLRAGYGISGNLTDRYSSLSTVASTPAYVFGDGGSTVYGLDITTLGNPNLGWEKTKEWNFALDFGVLNNRLTGTVEYYNRETNDLLYTLPLPRITGFSGIRSNVGKIGNQGLEISLTSKNIQTQNFNWSTSFSFARNVNKVLDLPNGEDNISAGLFIGRPLGTIYDYEIDGIYQIGETPLTGFYPGNYRIVDQNSDGSISTNDNNDRAFLGSTQAAYRFSFLNTFSYKNLTFSFFVNSIQGGKNGFLYENSPGRVQRTNVNQRTNLISGVDFWSPSNPDGKFQRYLTQGIVTGDQYQSRSFVRLQDITLSYRFDKLNFVKKAGLHNFSVFVSGKNLLTITNWDGWDPEIVDDNQRPIGGLSGIRPLLKGYSIGLKASL